MKLQLVLWFGLAVILTQSDVLASRPRHKKIATVSAQRMSNEANGSSYTAPAAGARPVASGPRPSPARSADPEQVRFEQAMAQAKQDAEVQDLKTKAERAAAGEDARRAAAAYNVSLFGKIRQIDPLVAERADLMEAAVLKRINE